MEIIPKLSREKLESIVSVILRVPGLLLLESWSKYQTSTLNDKKIVTVSLDEEMTSKLGFCVIPVGLLLLILPMPILITLYLHALAAVLLILANLVSLHFIIQEKHLALNNISTDSNLIYQHLSYIGIQFSIGFLIAYIIKAKTLFTRALLAIYIIPVVGRWSLIPMIDLELVHNFINMFMALQVLYYLLTKLSSVYNFIRTSCQQVLLIIELYGWLSLFTEIWKHIFVPAQFLVFWLILLINKLYIYWNSANVAFFSEQWLIIFFASIGECCASPFSLIGVCVSVSYLAYAILILSKFYLQGYEAFTHDNILHNGWTEGMTMLLLTLQTGITDVSPPQRAFLMSIILFIVFSSLIQSMYEIMDPILLALSASHSKNFFRHVRALIMSLVLFIFPIVMTYMLIQVFDVDFWLLVIISSCVLTSVQVLGSLIIYSLFMYDAFQAEPWENLDDIVYVAKSFIRVLEFVVAVFVVGYGIRESIISEFSWLNSSILIIHCYFNVWQRLQQGWQSFLLRREAVNKIQSLPEATEQQLLHLSDVCAICFQDMKSARVTPCQHYFHATCLRKWLYVQDNCPMCHRSVDLSQKFFENKSEESNNLSQVKSDNSEEHHNHSDNSNPIDTNSNSNQTYFQSSLPTDNIVIKRRTVSEAKPTAVECFFERTSLMNNSHESPLTDAVLL